MLRERVRPTLLGIGLIVMSVALVAGGIAAPATAATSPATAVAKILADTNALRAANGKAPLVENPAIEAVAQAWAAQMGAAGSLSHNPAYSDQMPADWSQAAENVATGYAYDRVVPDGWAKSSGHLANMLGDYTDIGIGYWESPTGVTYLVQDFGAYSSTPSSTPTPTATPTPSATPSSTPSPAPSSTAAAGASMPNLPTLPWWGGPAYYSKFSKAAASGWTSPSFFPIAVFFGKPADAPALKAAGINTYMGAEHDGSRISMMTSTGMSVIAQDEWTAAEVGTDPRVVGYHVSDECEMGSSGCSGSTETARLATQQQLATGMRKGDGRFLQSNFGNGVLGTYWAPNTMPQFVNSVDVTSVDKYAYTSPAVDGVIQQSWNWPSGKNPATSSAYGWLQDRMASYSGSATPNWVFVETAKPFLTESGARTIAPDQIEGAVWNAIIHGAAGISYFQHNNNGTCGTYSILQCGAALTQKITAIDAQVQSLAPVINTQSYKWSFGTGLDTSLKVSGGSAYVFAMTDGSTGTKTFTLPTGLAATVEVVGENRTVPVAGNGTFTDSFAKEYTHHIYKIALTGAPPVTGNDQPPSGGSSTPVPPVTTAPPAGDTMLPGQTLSAGSSLVAASNGFHLDMQSDGNLVEYNEAGRPIWNSRTSGQFGAHATMQADGNLVVYSTRMAPLWNSRTSGRPGAYATLQSDGNFVVYLKSGALFDGWTDQPPAPQDIDTTPTSEWVLQVGDHLAAGQELAHGPFSARMQTDGNLVVYNGGVALWSSQTYGNPSSRFVVQADGNLVIYAASGRAIWSTFTTGVSRLAMQADGNLVAYRSNGSAAWHRLHDTSIRISP